MLLETFTGVTSKNLRCENPTCGFIIQKSHATAGATLAHESVRIYVQRKNRKTQNIVENGVKLQALAEYEACKTGAYRESETLTEFPITLTVDSIDIDGQNEYIGLEFENLDSTMTYSVYYIESITTQAFEPFIFEKKEVASGVTRREQEIGDVDALILPVSGLTEIEIKYPSGQSQRLSPEELGVAQRMTNDIVKHSASGATYGFGAFYIINTGLASEIVVQCTSGGYTYFTKS